jgi:hypothetical protein
MGGSGCKSFVLMLLCALPITMDFLVRQVGAVRLGMIVFDGLSQSAAQGNPRFLRSTNLIGSFRNDDKAATRQRS